MTPRGWFAFLDSQSGEEIPTAVRFFFAALTGAGLSLSFIGLNLQIYSWVSIWLLLMLVMTPKSRVAFGFGFFHAVAFVLTWVPCLATVLSVHGGRAPRGGVGGCGEVDDDCEKTWNYRRRGRADLARDVRWRKVCSKGRRESFGARGAAEFSRS